MNTVILLSLTQKAVSQDTETMMTEINHVSTGQVTYAVRDTVIDDKEIKQGDFMGIGDKGILSVGNAIMDVTVGMIDEMVNDNIELISIYYGSDISEEDAEELLEEVEKKYSGCDIELQYGGQPIYYYIISAE